jgi:hypothetical protein
MTDSGEMTIYDTKKLEDIALQYAYCVKITEISSEIISEQGIT